MSLGFWFSIMENCVRYGKIFDTGKIHFPGEGNYLPWVFSLHLGHLRALPSGKPSGTPSGTLVKRKYPRKIISLSRKIISLCQNFSHNGNIYSIMEIQNPWDLESFPFLTRKIISLFLWSNFFQENFFPGNLFSGKNFP